MHYRSMLIVDSCYSKCDYNTITFHAGDNVVVGLCYCLNLIRPSTVGHYQVITLLDINILMFNKFAFVISFSNIPSTSR